jgi:hypothetical protein
LTFLQFHQHFAGYMEMPFTPSDDHSPPEILIETLAETLTVVKKIIERSVRPLSADEIHHDIPGLYQLKKPDLVRLLKNEAADGTCHRWPAGPGSRKERFWRQNETAYFQDRILSALSRQMLTKADLLEKVKKDAVPCSKTQLTRIVNTTLAAHIKEKTLFEIPPWGSYKKSRYAAHPPDLTVYLGKMQKEFDRVRLKLKKAGIGAEQVFAAFEKMLSLPRTASSPSAAAYGENFQTPLPEPVISEMVLSRIVKTMLQIVPNAANQAPVWIPDLRNALNLPKYTFDLAILILAKQGTIFLNRHAHPAQMTGAEKETMIADGRGNYYVVAVLREGKSG